MDAESILRLGDAYCAATALARKTVSTYAANHGAFLDRLAGMNGKPPADITTRRAARIVQWFSDHWPLHAEWPQHLILRPPPAPPPGDPIQVIEELRERRMELTDPDREGGPAPFHVVASNAKVAMLAAGAQLAGDGRLASRDALAAALFVSRKTVDNVISDAPRRPTGGDALDIYHALVGAGDVRFTKRGAAA